MDYFYGAALVAFMGLKTEQEKADATAFYQRYRHLVFYAIKKSVTQTEAVIEDAIQEALVVMLEDWQKYAGYTEEHRRNTFIHIATNKAIDLLRKEHYDKREPYDEMQPQGEETDIAITHISKEAYHAALKWMEQLPEKYKVVLQMRFVSEMTNSEIAEELGIKPSTVSMRTKRALEMLKAKMLKAKMLEEGYDDGH